MKIKYIFFNIVVLCCIATSVNSALLSRLGGLAYYDTELDITWLANANLATYNLLSDDFHEDFSPYITVDGRTQQWVAEYMIQELNEGAYLNSDSWRLPSTGPINGVSYNFTSSTVSGTSDWGDDLSAPDTPYAGSTINEMAHLFYNTLGNTSDGGIGRFNPGPFTDIATHAYYLTGTTIMHKGYDRDFLFTFNGGVQFYTYHNTSSERGYIWAVQDGDISAVPLPGAAWLFFNGIIGLLLFHKKQKHA